MRCLFTTFIVFIDYMLMLIVMTFNVAIIIFSECHAAQEIQCCVRILNKGGRRCIALGVVLMLVAGRASLCY